MSKRFFKNSEKNALSFLIKQEKIIKKVGGKRRIFILKSREKDIKCVMSKHELGYFIYSMLIPMLEKKT